MGWDERRGDAHYIEVQITRSHVYLEAMIQSGCIHLQAIYSREEDYPQTECLVGTIRVWKLGESFQDRGQLSIPFRISPLPAACGLPQTTHEIDCQDCQWYKFLKQEPLR